MRRVGRSFVSLAALSKDLTLLNELYSMFDIRFSPALCFHCASRDSVFDERKIFYPFFDVSFEEN